ncbi:hypothetical protein OTU49_004667, partial [Cherax quadricarinatus]
RGVLQKANVTPSLLSDVAAARTIIGVVEQSVELMRRSLQLQRAKKRNQENEEAKGEPQPHVYESVDTERVVAASPTRHKLRDNKDGKSSRFSRDQSSQARRPSSSKQSRLREMTPVRQSGRSQERVSPRESVLREDSRRRSPDKRSCPPRSNSTRPGDARESSVDHHVGRKGRNRERGREHLVNSRIESKDRCRVSRHSSENKKDKGRGRVARGKKDHSTDRKAQRERLRDNRDRSAGHCEWNDECGYDRERHALRQAAERRNGIKEKYSRDRRSNSLESRREYVNQRSKSRDQHSSSNERRLSSSDRHSEFRREISRRKFYSRERQSKVKKMGGKNRRGGSPERLVDSRDSLGESPEESWTSAEGTSSTG